MSDLGTSTALPVFITDVQPLAVIDDAAVSQAQAVLTANGITVDTGILQQALTAAVTPPPAPDAIPVSIGMVAAGRAVWASNPAASPNVLLPLIFQAMTLQQQAENAAVVAAEPPTPATLALAP